MEPQEPGPFAPPPTPVARVGSRIMPMQLATVGIVAGVAVALLVYFLIR